VFTPCRQPGKLLEILNCRDSDCPRAEAPERRARVVRREIVGERESAPAIEFSGRDCKVATGHNGEGEGKVSRAQRL